MTPTGPERCLCTALRQAARRVSQHYDAALDTLGVSTNQFAILRRLERHGGAPIQELAASLVMDRSTLGHLLRPLEQRDFVRLAAPASDRRRREVHLTLAGAALIEQGRPLWQIAQERFEDAFGADEAAALRGHLRRVCTTDPGAPRAPVSSRT